jgi:hypothetical protein
MTLMNQCSHVREEESLTAHIIGNDMSPITASFGHRRQTDRVQAGEDVSDHFNGKSVNVSWF